MPAGDAFQYVLSKLNVAEAHGIATGNQVPVAVIDSAIDQDHPELRGIIAARLDFGAAVPGHAHGTAMASAIAAHGRLLGLAPAVRILAARAFDASAVGAQGTSTRILDGLQWAVNSGARVVNMSFTGPADRKLHEMIAAARQRGVVLVAAAGNDGPQAPEAYPAAYPEVIAVTATDVDDKSLAVANRGSYVAVAAPGVDIFVAAPNGGYDYSTGTSVAAAHVSGLAALLIERNPGLTFEVARSENYEPPEPVDATICLRSFYYPPDRQAFFRRVRGYTRKKFVFDFRPRVHDSGRFVSANTATQTRPVLLTS